MYSVFARLTKSDCIKMRLQLWADIPPAYRRQEAEASPFDVHCQGRNPPLQKDDPAQGRASREVEDYTRAAPDLEPPPSSLTIGRTAGYIHPPSPPASRRRVCAQIPPIWKQLSEPVPPFWTPLSLSSQPH